MRIELSKTLVEFTPEADYEKTMLEGLWRMLVDCARFNQKLAPVGEYVPAKSNTARFAVEGDKGEAVFVYRKPLTKQDLKSSGFPVG